jgi:uncharacterized protein YdhG (YjbR/CyaY superfamily)
MVQSKAETVDEYLAELPAERRSAIAAARKVILENLPEGYEETMQYGMISYVVPLERYPDTHNSQALAIAALASQKNYMALYLMNIYGDKKMQRRFVQEYKASGKKLDLGKSCVRFRSPDSLPLELVGKTIAGTPVSEFIKQYEKARKAR